MQSALNTGGYILVVEGGIPTGFGGNACTVWLEPGVGSITSQQAVTQLAANASQVLCFGTCAAWGGVPGVNPNPAAIQPVSAIIGRSTINVGGCPPHPNWMVWTILNAIAGTLGALDVSGRPLAIYGSNILHNSCVREPNLRTVTYGQDTYCLRYLGCKGPQSYAPCPTMRWNNGINYCQEANTICLGCVEAGFPGTAAIRTQTTIPVTFSNRVNCGGSAFTDTQGKLWSADAGFNNGTPKSVTVTIQGTTDQLLYQTWRLGPRGEALVYTFNGIPNGNCMVNMKFDETYWTSSGKRKFHIAINGQTVLPNFDIFAAAGGANKAVDRQIPVVVSAGQVVIQFTPVIDCPKICAIEIVSV
jgi:coenzyme F420-reducing hydrogenase gamma subunit